MKKFQQVQVWSHGNPFPRLEQKDTIENITLSDYVEGANKTKMSEFQNGQESKDEISEILLTQLFGGFLFPSLLYLGFFQMYQSFFLPMLACVTLSRNQGCWSDVWFGIKSMITFSPENIITDIFHFLPPA